MKHVAIVLLAFFIGRTALAQTDAAKDSMLYYFNNNNFAKAVEWGERHVAYVKDKAGTSDTTYAEALNNLAFSLYQHGNYPRSKELFTEAAGIYRKQRDTANEHYLTLLVNLSNAHLKTGDYQAGIECVSEAIHTRQQKNDTLNAGYGDCLTNLGLLYKSVNRYPAAEALYLRALAIFEKAQLTQRVQYASALTSTGSLYYELGKYKEAETYLLQSANLYKSLLGEENWEYAVSLNNLASLYYQLGNYKASTDLFVKMLPVVEKQLGTSHGFYGTVIGNLAAIYYQMGLYDQSLPYMLRQLQINKEKFGENSQEYSAPLNNLGNLYFRIKDLDKAREYFTASQVLRKKVYGEKSILHGAAVSNLGLLNTRLGKYKEADSLYKYALSLLAEAAGTNHTEYLNVLNNYCEYLQKSGRYTKDLSAPLQLLMTETALLKEKLDYLSVTELQAYTTTRSFAFTQPVSALSVQPSGKLAKAVYDNLLFLKGIAIQNFTSLSKEMERLSDSNVVNRWKKYKADKVNLNKLLVTPAPKRTMNVDSLAGQLNAQEKELLTIATPYRKVQQQLNIGWQEVQKALKPAEASIEFVRYRLLNPHNDYEFWYGALLLRRRDTVPVFIKLCTENDLTAALRRFSYKNNSVPAAKTATTRSVYQLVIQPLEKNLAGIHTLYFSPDGLLHQLSFAAIPTTGDRLLIDQYKLVQLTSTRQIALADHATDTVTSAALFGGIDYNRQNADTAAANADAFAYVYQQNHRNLADSFPALPNTLQEIDNITTSLQAVHAGIYRYTGAIASESNFRLLCSTAQPSIIHFATHGFTLPDTTRQAKINNPYATSNNPLLRTGLILAAGNKGWKNRNQLGEDDGVLTGLEIAAMQLQHTQLVVLSACETANGEVRGSEGVFGLQRAFKMTGVNYVLATLWQVPDEETKSFMTLFYKNWLPGHSIQQAFYRTQHSYRQRKVSPYYWAGFVLLQ